MKSGFPLSLHHVGGHTMGLQFARVYTRRGWAVVASDAAHFQEGWRCCRPLPLVFHVGDMVRGFARIRELADSDDHVVPGHDAIVMRNYPAVSPQLQGIAVRLDAEPESPDGAPCDRGS